MNIKMDKLEELLSLLKKKEDEKQKNTVLWVSASFFDLYLPRQNVSSAQILNLLEENNCIYSAIIFLIRPKRLFLRRTKVFCKVFAMQASPWCLSTAAMTAQTTAMY